MSENEICVKLPKGVILTDYAKSRMQNIRVEEVKFLVGDTIYKVRDTVIHFANRPKKKPKYEIVQGKIKAIYHRYNQFNNVFEVVMEVVINEKGHYYCFDQKDCFLEEEWAQEKMEELAEGALHD